MKTTPRSEAEAQKISRRTPIPVGWHEAQIHEASETRSKYDNEMIELSIFVFDTEGNERILKDWLTNSKLGAVRLRHACEAIGALAQYDAGEIVPTIFPGCTCRVYVGIEKKRGYHDRNVIQDYAASTAKVVNLPRTA
jgi:hypothetical protein